MFDNKSNTNNANVSGSVKPKFVAKGHDAILKGAQDTGSQVRIVCISGVDIQGKMVNRDKYTITIEFVDGIRQTFYKHAIEFFQVIKAVH